MKKIVFVAAGLIAMLLAGCEQKARKDVNYMTVQADGRIMTAPDMAVLMVNIKCVDRDITKSSDCMMEKADKVAKIAGELGIDGKDIQNSNIFQNKEYRWNGRTEAFMGYRSSMTTTLTIKNVDILGKLYPKLLADDKIDVGRLQYATSRQDSLKLEAQTNALENAHDMIDNWLKSSGGKKGRIVSMSNVASGVAIPNGFMNTNNLVQEESAMVDMANRRAMQINTGQIEIRETLYVVFEIE